MPIEIIFQQIEGDIGKELYLTHNLTKISSKMGMILRRFNALEEGVIEVEKNVAFSSINDDNYSLLFTIITKFLL